MDDARRRPDAQRIAELARRVHGRARWGSRAGIDADAVAALAATRSVLALPYLVDLAIEHRVRDIVAAAIEAIVEGSDPARLPAADAQVRSGWLSDPWTGATPRAFERDVRRAHNATGVLLAGGMCRNGFVRQRAIALLYEHMQISPDARLRLLLLRANDWVPQVRHAALDQLGSISEDVAAPVLIRALPLVQRLHHLGRLDDPGMADHLVAIAVGRGWHDLLAGLDAEHLSILRCCAQLALLASHDNGKDAAADLVLDRVADPVSRVLAAQTMIAADPHGSAAIRLVHDRTTQVRLTALHHQITTGAADVATLVDALTDPSRRIRAVAQHHAARGGVDVPAHYRTWLDRHPSDAVCVRGLGEVGHRSDADGILPLTTHERVRVRTAAVTAVGRLDATGHQDVLFRAVADQSPGVSRAARTALEAARAVLDPIRVARCIADCTADHAVTNAVRLASRVDRWPQLWLYLEALPRLPPPGIRVAVDRLGRWHAGYRRTWNTTPSPGDLARARRALAHAADTLPRQLHADLTDDIAS